MTRRALRDVLFRLATAVVDKLRGNPDRLGRHVGRAREFVTSIAVRSDWFLRLPMTVETRTVIGGRGFERRRSRSVTDGAVVVILRRVCETQERDRVLMLIVRKLDRELQHR